MTRARLGLDIYSFSEVKMLSLLGVTVLVHVYNLLDIVSRLLKIINIYKTS